MPWFLSETVNNIHFRLAGVFFLRCFISNNYYGWVGFVFFMYIRFRCSYVAWNKNRENKETITLRIPCHTDITSRCYLTCIFNIFFGKWCITDINLVKIYWEQAWAEMSDHNGKKSILYVEYYYKDIFNLYMYYTYFY